MYEHTHTHTHVRNNDNIYMYSESELCLCMCECVEKINKRCSGPRVWDASHTKGHREIS